MAKAKRGGKTLVIVESPAKAKTINKYLGGDYVVKASMGHVRDLPKDGLGIDLDNDYAPTYEVVTGRVKAIKELRKLAGSAPEVVLATDRDREGEAIAWHLVEALGLEPERIRRVIFNEITQSAIAEAFAHPHELDMDRVYAQQARRVLDRIVGYQLSPLLWQKIAKGLSAGRVQSVAVRLIVEREREIRAFVPEESWKVVAYFSGDANAPTGLRPDWDKLNADEPTQKAIQQWLSGHGSFRTELSRVGGQPFKPDQYEAARAAVEALGFQVSEVAQQDWAEYDHLGLKQVKLVGGFPAGDTTVTPTVAKLVTKRTTTRPPGPFTTATLQQAASTRLSFTTKRTMQTAQKLYEGIDLGDGPVGLITYMRTDSTHLAKDAIEAVRRQIASDFGNEYVPAKPNFYGKQQARAQEAHEAIRPTDPSRTPDSLKKVLDAGQHRLYTLIWNRFVACQMPPAQWDSTTITIGCDTRLGEAEFTGNGRKLVFDGFMRVAGVSSEDQILPALEEGDPVGLLDLDPQQSWTSPPARYTEASLVKAMESEGIGRPSTYAAIIETVQARGYVELEERKFFPTALGEIVTEKLVEHFPKIMDVKFTSHMEDELDKIEDAHLDWVEVLNEFYLPFRDLLEQAGVSMEAVKAQPSPYKCPECDGEMVYRWSKNGRFLSCTNYPTCKGTLNVNRRGEPLTAGDQTCAECGKSMILRQSRSGYFLGCSGYPECRNTVACDEQGVPLEVVPEEELTRPCDACGEGTLKVKWRRMQAYLACDRYPKCKNTDKIPEEIHVKKKPAPPPEEAGVACEKCERPMVIREGSRGKFLACIGYPKCRNSKPLEKLDELKKAMKEAGRTVQPLAEYEAQKAAGKLPKGSRKKVDIEALGEPPKGFAWTRTGRPVVETLPPEDEELNCPECGRPVSMKRGRFGPFFSCTNYPKCKFNCNLRGQAKKDAEELMPAPDKPKPIPTDIECEECGQHMLLREGRSGKFLGCSAYPKCKATQEVPPGFKIPEVEAVSK